MTMTSRRRPAATLSSSLPASLLVVTLLAACAALSGGCAGGAPKPVSAGATVHGTEDINPNRQGRASPVRVRIFRLSADEAFRSAGIVNLQGDEPALVAGDLTGPVLSELLRPGQTITLDLSYAPETAFLGVVAEFIDPDAEWRTVVAVPERGLLRAVRSPALTVTVSADRVVASFE